MTMLTKALSTITISCATLCSGAHAQGNADVPFGPNGPVPYYYMDECPGERGLAYALYLDTPLPAGVVSHRATTEDIILTDVCFLKEHGILHGFESIRNLTLVADGATHQRYEILDPDQNNRSPNTLEIYQDGAGDDSLGLAFGPNVSTFSIDIHSGEIPRNYDGRTGTYALVGFLFGEETPPNSNLENYDVYVSSINMDIGAVDGRVGLEEPRGSSEWPSLSNLVGELNFAGANGTANLTMSDINSWFHMPAAGGGTLSLKVDAKGGVSGYGQFDLNNPRLAGAAPDDWKRSNWQLIQVVGHLLGNRGQDIAAVGIVRGTTIDHNGTRTRVFVPVEIFARRKE